MPGKLEKLEATAAQLLEAGLIDSLDEFDEAAAEIMASYYRPAMDDVALDKAALALRAKLCAALEEAERGEFRSYASIAEASDDIERLAEKRTAQ